MSEDLLEPACPVPDQPASEPELVVITGMSGAGRSQAIHTFEDLGYFCIDNLPPSFLPQLVQLAKLPGNRIGRLALVSDVRGHQFFSELAAELKALDDQGVGYHVLYLEADDETLLRRFKETRRRHPLCDEGFTLPEAIEAERRALDAVRARADVVIDTTHLKPADLTREIRDRFFSGPLADTLAVTVSSFGFKYGLPSDADIVMDVRFLPNPYYVADLRDLTGLERRVREFVLDRDETRAFLNRWYDLLDVVMPGYLAEGKHHLGIALGCTGGMHRSVALAEETALFLQGRGYRAVVSHRDIGRDRGSR